MQQIAFIKIPNPLEYIDITGKRIDKKTGEPKRKRYYLTANIFYGGVHERIRMLIVEKIKFFLFPYLRTLPSLSCPPYSIVIQYCRPKRIDVSNVCYFWDKIICDMMAPPVPKTAKILQGKSLPIQENNLIDKTACSRLNNDNSDYIDCVGYEYYSTNEHCINLYILKSEA